MPLPAAAPSSSATIHGNSARVAAR
jgi:hypothetical protein